jgi:ribosomal biogenesis protein LAS1
VMDCWRKVLWCHFQRSESKHNQKLLPSLSDLILNFIPNRKRLFPLDSFSPPNSSVALWVPLLGHIRSNHPTFPFALVQRIIAFLLSDSPNLETLSDELGHPDTLFDMCLARWAFWIINSWNVDEEFEVDFKRDVTVTLVNFLGPGSTDTARDSKACVLPFRFVRFNC